MSPAQAAAVAWMLVGMLAPAVDFAREPKKGRKEGHALFRSEFGAFAWLGYVAIFAMAGVMGPLAHFAIKTKP